MKKELRYYHKAYITAMKFEGEIIFDTNYRVSVATALGLIYEMYGYNKHNYPIMLKIDIIHINSIEVGEK